MLHSLTPYIIRCFNKAYINVVDGTLHDGKSNRNYMPTNDLSGKDLFDLLKEFLVNQQQQSKKLEEQQVIYKVDDDVTFDESGRRIYGYINKGIWGHPALIKDVEEKIPDYDMSHLQAPMIRYFFYFYLPLEQAEGICLFHSIGTGGVRTIFEEEFRKTFQSHLPNFVLQYNPLQYSEIYEEWSNAVAKRICIRKFKNIKEDKADTINNVVGDSEQELILKIKNPINHLKDFFTKDTSESKMIEVLEAEGSQVKGEFELDGKKRTFRLGKTRSAKCDIIINDDEVSRENGILNHEELLEYCIELITEITKRIY